jgi:hypothetical protein
MKVSQKEGSNRLSFAEWVLVIASAIFVAFAVSLLLR